MAIKSREELIAQVTATIGANTSDEAIALIEDVSDTLTDLETKANGDGTDWKSEAERIDKEWREKYVSRFTSGSNKEDDKEDDTGKEEEKDYSFENLFKGED